MQRFVRCYSAAADAGKSVFLSDILKRIENIGLSKSGSQYTKKPSVAAPKRPQPETANFNRLRDRKIAVADHPMYSNKFKSQFKDARAEKSRSSRPRTTKPRTPGNNARKPVARKAVGASQASTIVSKTVVAHDYSPKISGDDFLHGKATSFQFNVTSRLTSVLKSQLLESRYPYKVPKHIIDNAPAETKSKFLLSSSYNSDIDQTALKNQIQKVALGQYHMDQLPGDSVVVQTLNKNGDLNIVQKHALFNLIQNPQSAKI